MITLGFTGTRRGMTGEQRAALRNLLTSLPYLTEFHHGDCVGADKEAHDIVREIGGIRIVIHPPMDDRFRAFCDGDKVKPIYAYLDRNCHIVDDSDALIACPYQDSEVLRSGPCATIQYAISCDKPIIIIYPDGKELVSSWRS